MERFTIEPKQTHSEQRIKNQVQEPTSQNI